MDEDWDYDEYDDEWIDEEDYEDESCDSCLQPCTSIVYVIQSTWTPDNRAREPFRMCGRCIEKHWEPKYFSCKVCVENWTSRDMVPPHETRCLNCIEDEKATAIEV